MIACIDCENLIKRSDGAYQCSLKTRPDSLFNLSAVVLKTTIEKKTHDKACPKQTEDAAKAVEKYKNTSV